MGMKYVCLSFDDARSDTYDVALPIIKRYGIKATINVISDFISNRQDYHFKSAPNPMTWEQILQCQKEGIEIACHGRTHENSAVDITQNIKELDSHGIDVSTIGFASPNSCLTVDNMEETGISQLLRNKTIRYARSGIQVRREGLLYFLGAGLERVTHNKYLYWLLNKRNLMSISNLPVLYPSSAIKDYTTVNQLNYFIDHMVCGDIAILMFHSILSKSSPYYGADHYYWDAEKFDELCMCLTQNHEVRVITTIDIAVGIQDGK